MADEPLRGEIWLADLDPTAGREQAGRRPVLIVSTNTFNRGRADLVIALPLTTSARAYPFRVAVLPPEGRLRSPSYVLCDNVRSISKGRLVERWGSVSADTMEEIADNLRILMEL